MNKQKNATTEGLKALHQMVTEVKQDGEVGLAYMKSFEIEQRILNEGRAEGRAEGLAGSVITILSRNGEVPGNLKERIMAENDMELLNRWIMYAVDSKSFEDFMRRANI